MLEGAIGSYQGIVFKIFMQNYKRLVIHRYVYARIASLKAIADQVVTIFVENMKHLELFMNRENVPFLLKKSIVDYWKYQWKRTGGWSVSLLKLLRTKESV